jgi:hypothetical protein
LITTPLSNEGKERGQKFNCYVSATTILAEKSANKKALTSLAQMAMKPATLRSLIGLLFSWLFVGWLRRIPQVGWNSIRRERATCRLDQRSFDPGSK